MSSDSSASGQTIGDTVNFFDSESGKFVPDRSPKDQTKPTHEPDEQATDTPGQTDTDTDLPTTDELLDRGGAHDYVPGINRDAYVAGTLLRSIGNPPLYCPDCYHHFGDESELSEPKHHLPLVEELFIDDGDSELPQRKIVRNDHRRHRDCPECGAVSFGGVLGDRAAADFADLLDIIFDAMENVSGSDIRELKQDAMDRKTNDAQSDEANVEELLREVRTNN